MKAKYAVDDQVLGPLQARHIELKHPAPFLEKRRLNAYPVNPSGVRQKLCVVADEQVVRAVVSRCQCPVRNRVTSSKSYLDRASINAT